MLKFGPLRFFDFAFSHQVTIQVMSVFWLMQ